MATRWVGRAPGRLDLMGGAAAGAGSLVLEATLREGIWATIELRDDLLVRVFGAGAERTEFSLDDLGEEPQLRDPAGAAIFLLKQWYPELVTRGSDIWIKSEFPPACRAGWSPSTAVAVMKTAARAYGVELDGVELATACQWVENALAGAACGGAGQASAAMGEEGCVLPVLCQPCIPGPPVRLPEELRLWGRSRLARRRSWLTS
jgi:L-arabinokinase